MAEAARRALRLDRVFFVPASVPPHRGVPRASAAHRFAMVALALARRPAFLVSDLEMQGDGPSYTSDTLDRLAARGVDTRACGLITGADAFQDIGSWKNYPALLDRCHLIVVSRPGRPAPGLLDTLPALRARMTSVAPDGGTPLPATPGILLVDAPTAPVSSTEVRRRIAEGAPLSGLVLTAIEEYIKKHGLYVEKA